MGVAEVEAFYRTDPTLIRIATGRGAPGLDHRASRRASARAGRARG
jgi:hypothetical protein